MLSLVLPQVCCCDEFFKFSAADYHTCMSLQLAVLFFTVVEMSGIFVVAKLADLSKLLLNLVGKKAFALPSVCSNSSQVM